jgi:DNA-binding winged helix-turn-helix (wHTH) protein
MNTPAPAHVLRFGVFELDIDSGELRRHGLKIRLPDQSFQILKGLLSRPGEVVTREELRRVLWSSDTFVEFEVGLNSAVRKLREALDDSADNPRFVDTVPRRGYRFIAPVSVPAVEVVRVQVQVQASPADAPPFAPDPVAVVALPAEAVTPQPRRWRLTDRRAAGVLIVLCAVILAAAGAAMNQRGDPSRRDVAVEPIRAFLVLPFENLTGDAAQTFLSTASPML